MSLDKNKIEKLLRNGATVKEIALELCEKENSISKCVNRNFKHIVEALNKEKEDKIASLYEKGYTASAIAAQFDNMPVSSVKNYFKLDRFKELKYIHEVNLKEKKNRDKEIKRILNKEDNSKMSTRSFVMQNIQSYEQQKDGTYIFNSKRGLAALGVPRKYVFQV